ncbi:F0F1 ATP synthase subunit B' [uncultured Campylobacter sp.]|uniref:F0F1 ATP synthase subunit B family protein n=1 Tax=uncultured Campylobacter sp. TaxID=218934 RepID=UPI0026115A69|nr:F0F1 ATP synthase subunit B' [uncultured Campylobacter sp.]
MFDDVHLSTILSTVVIFLLMIVVLNAILYKPLLSFMGQRDESIKSDEAKVKQDFEKISTVAEELEKIKQSTREEIFQIKQRAVEVARAEAETEFNKKKQELEEKMSNFYLNLEKDKKNLEEELKTHISEWKNTLNANLKNI